MNDVELYNINELGIKVPYFILKLWQDKLNNYQNLPVL